MKRIYTASLALLALSSAAMADINVKVSPAVTQTEFDVEYSFISDLVKPRMQRPEPNRSTFTVENGGFTIPVMTSGAARYVIPTGQGEYVVIYTHPGDELTLNLEAVSPLSYSVSGSKLMEDIAALDMANSKLIGDFQALMETGAASEADMEKVNDELTRINTDYIAANKDSEAVAYAVMQLEGEDFINAYNAMSDRAKESILIPMLEVQKSTVERRLEAERRKALLSSGTVDAPDFTFNNVDGKPVSLSDFKGKWVVIDFWGTWCPWCIKGFPALKKAYAELKPELEVLGVACNDKYEAWVKGLKKYELPWVNVYNPEEGGGKILEDYAVEGFPTKVIVNPEGKIVNITTGENPEFFNILNEMIKK